MVPTGSTRDCPKYDGVRIANVAIGGGIVRRCGRDNGFRQVHCRVKRLCPIKHYLHVFTGPSWVATTYHRNRKFGRDELYLNIMTQCRYLPDLVPTMDTLKMINNEKVSLK